MTIPRCCTNASATPFQLNVQRTFIKLACGAPKNQVSQKSDLDAKSNDPSLDTINSLELVKKPLAEKRFRFVPSDVSGGNVVK
jgi:hypothetical protein